MRVLAGLLLTLGFGVEELIVLVTERTHGVFGALPREVELAWVVTQLVREHAGVTFPAGVAEKELADRLRKGGGGR